MSDKQTKKKKFWKSFFNWLIGRESDRWEVHVNRPGWPTSVNSIASPPDGLPFWKVLIIGIVLALVCLPIKASVRLAKFIGGAKD